MKKNVRKPGNIIMNIKEKNSVKMILIDSIILVIAIAADQISKYFITMNLKGNPPIELIKNILQFYYHENRGAAFGILQGQTIFFVFIAIVVFGVMSFIIYKIPSQRKYIKLNIALVLILAGAIGNTLDRVIKGFVTDFIYFKIIEFPIFNVADIYITIATFAIIIMILFLYKEDDLQFMSISKKSTRTLTCDDTQNEAEQENAKIKDKKAK